MKAIILAAGSGIKSHEMTESIPTCLMKIGKETLLQRQIKILKDRGINDIVIIVGQEGNCWNIKNINLIIKTGEKVIINPINAQTPSSSSLILGLKYFKKNPFLVIDGDTVFEESLIKSILKNKSKNVLLVENVKPHRKGNKVKIEKNKIIEISREIDSDKIYGGLMKISGQLSNNLKDYLEKKENQQIEFTEVLNHLLGQYEIGALDIEKISSDVGDLFDSRPLTGGSFANTKIISKLIKKTSYIVKKEATKGREKLIDEITWIKNLPRDLVPYFPKIISYEIKKKEVWYEMPYYNLPTLREIIVRNIVTKKESLYILKVLINLMSSKFYNKKINADIENYPQKVHLKRVKDRIIETSKRSKIMKKIISSEYLIIDGKKFENLPKIINHIEKDKDLLKKLTPPFLCKVHGDLHLDNILVDISQMPMIKFILFDPRGLENYNYSYDLGKLFFSLHGKYDLTHEGLFNLKHSFRDNKFIAKINFKDRKLFLTFNYLYEKIKKSFQEKSFLKKDKNWLLRTYFSEVAHFCSNMPFHLKEDEKEKIAIGLYIMGTKLANEFMLKYSKKYKKGGEIKSFFNINSFKEYELAKMRFETQNE